MPCKYLTIYDPGIAVLVPGVAAEDQAEALESVMPSQDQFAKRLLEWHVSTLHRPGLPIPKHPTLGPVHGLVRQLRNAPFKQLGASYANWWDDAIYATDAEWLRSFGLEVYRGADRFARCNSCSRRCSADATGCDACGAFDGELAYGSSSGLQIVVTYPPGYGPDVKPALPAGWTVLNWVQFCNDEGIQIGGPNDGILGPMFRNLRSQQEQRLGCDGAE